MYSAGLGSGNRTLPEVMKIIQDQTSQFFAPRASKPRINKLLKEIEHINRELREHILDQDKYDDVFNELETAGVSIETTGQQLNNARKQQRQLQHKLDIWDQWINLNNKRDQLKEVPFVEAFPTDGVKRFDRLKTEQESYQERLQEKQSKSDADKHSKMQLTVDSQVLSLSKKIESVSRGLVLYIQNCNDKKSSQSRFESAEQQMNKVLRDLGEDWNVERLSNFDLSVTMQERFKQTRAQLVEATNQVNEHSIIHSQHKEHYNDKKSQKKQANKELAGILQTYPNLDIEGIKKVQMQLANYQSNEQELSKLTQECKSSSENLATTLRSIGSDWTEDKLQQFDASIAIHEQVSDFKKTLAKAEVKQSNTNNRLEDLKDRVENAESKLANTKQLLSELSEPEISDELLLTNNLKKLKKLRRKYTENVQNKASLSHYKERLNDLDGQLNRLDKLNEVLISVIPRWLIPMLLVIGIAGAVGIWFFLERWLEASVFFGLIMLFLVIVLFLKSKQGSDKSLDDKVIQKQELQESMDSIINQSDKKQSEINSIETTINDLLKVLKLNEPVNQQLIDDVESTMEGDINLLKDRKPLELQQIEESGVLAKLKDRISNNQEDTESTNTELQNIQKQWQKWLADKGLPETLTPENTGHVLGKIDTAWEQLRDVNKYRERIAALEKEIQSYIAFISEVVNNSDLEEQAPSGVELTVGFLDDCLTETVVQQRLLSESQSRLRQLEKEFKREKNKLQEIEKKYNNKISNRHKIEQQWLTVLKELNLAEDTSIEMAGTLYQTVEKAMDKYQHVDALDTEKNTLNGLIKKFHTKSENLLKKLGRASTEPVNLEIVIPSLVDELESARNQQRDFKNLDDNILVLDTEIFNLNKQLNRRKTDIDDLFQAAGSNDEEVFRDNANNYNERITLEGTIRDLEIQIKNQACRGEKFSILEKELYDKSEDELKTEMEELELIVNELDEQHQQLIHEKGQLGEQLNNLEKSDEVTSLKTEKQSNLSQLSADAEDWSVLKITGYLIDKAREKYEKERRPGVLKEAEKYFRHFTAGRYTDVQAPLGDEEIRVRSKNEPPKKINQLSTGTAEQLYLSLRFGFVKEFVQRSASLPLIFDDILVNFDPDRARAASEAIVELAKSQQIIYFTCQPATVDLLKEIDDSIPVLNLKGGKLY